jgi:hypothetical protein
MRNAGNIIICQRGPFMKCPKCGVRIGIQQHHLETVFGQAVGVRCYICGFWVQAFPITKQLETRGMASSAAVSHQVN